MLRASGSLAAAAGPHPPVSSRAEYRFAFPLMTSAPPSLKTRATLAETAVVRPTYASEEQLSHQKPTANGGSSLDQSWDRSAHKEPSPRINRVLVKAPRMVSW